MGAKYFIRETVFFYIAYKLLIAGITKNIEPLSLIIYSLIMFAFMIWFFIGKIGAS